MLIPTQWFPIPRGAAMGLVLIEKLDDGEMIQMPIFIHVQNLMGKDKIQLEKLADEAAITGKLLLARAKGDILAKKEAKRKEQEQCESSSVVPTELETERKILELPDDLQEKQ